MSNESLKVNYNDLGNFLLVSMFKNIISILFKIFDLEIQIQCMVHPIH